jgi:hypothetical protein
MQEKEIINKIQYLKEIKPNESWVTLTKNEIIDKKEEVLFAYPIRHLMARSTATAFASLGFVAFFLISVQASFPGDTLYPVKRITEKGKMAILSESRRQEYNMELTNKRLEEVSKIVKKNEIEKLSLAVKELESMKSEMQKDFSRSVENKSKEKTVEIAKNLAPAFLEMEDREELLLGSLGVRAEEDETVTSVSKDSVLILIQDLEERSLSEEDEFLLQEAKKHFQEKSYSIALRTVLQIGQEKEKKIDINLEKVKEEK